MPARKRHEPEPRPMWAYTDKGKVLSCPKGLPDGAVLSCREGDREWMRVDTVTVARPTVKMAAAPSLYDTPEDE